MEEIICQHCQKKITNKEDLVVYTYLIGPFYTFHKDCFSSIRLHFLKSISWGGSVWIYNNPVNSKWFEYGSIVHAVVGVVVTTFLLIGVIELFQKLASSEIRLNYDLLPTLILGAIILLILYYAFAPILQVIRYYFKFGKSLSRMSQTS